MPTPPATTDPPTTRETFVPPLVRAASEWAWRSIVIGVAAIAFLYLLGFLSEVVIPLTVGLLLCALLSSIHLRLARVMPRGAAAGVTVLGTLLVIAGLLVLVGTQISGGFDSMSEQVSTGITQVRDWIRGTLGISGLDVRLDDVIQRSEHLDQTSGVLLLEVAPGGSAARASLHSGDIILSLGEHTTDTIDALRKAVQALKGSSPWRVSFLRAGRRRRVSLVPA